MTQTNLTMTSLYDRLAAIGFPKKFVQANALPDWWCEEVDKTPGVLIEAAMYVSRRLNLDIQSLLSPESVPMFEPVCQPKFKLKEGTNSQQLTIPRALSARIAELTAYVCIPPYRSIEGLSVLEIRQQILQTQPVVNLPSFLNFCWQQGIPVVHFSEFPPDVHRFHGMVAYFYDRPVILISLRDPSPAWLLFIAAHELGHILKGHLTQDGLLVDETIELESEDSEESEANQVAAELLLGRTGISYDLWHRYLSSEQLVNKSREWADRDRVDPGVIAINISWNRAQRATTEEAKSIIWATGRKALKTLEPHANAPQMINQQASHHLDWERLSEDNEDYLSAMLGLTL